MQQPKNTMFLKAHKHEHRVEDGTWLNTARHLNQFLVKNSRIKIIVNRFLHCNIISAVGNKRTLIAKGDYEVRVI